MFQGFLSKNISYARELSFQQVIYMFNTAVNADIRVTRIITADCVAAILSAVVNATTNF